MIDAFEQEILNEEGVPALWAQSIRGAGVTVGVLDSGVRANAFPERLALHEDLSGAHLPEDTLGHGTEMSGIILRYAPDSRIASLKVLDRSGVMTRETVIAGLDYASQHPSQIRLMNLSLGVRRKFWRWATCTQARPCRLCKKVNTLAESGRILVAAAGNQGPGADTLTCPGIAVGAYTVGATMKPIEEVPGSWDPFLKRWLPSIYYRRHGLDVGTSLATARVTGSIALLLSKFPEAKTEEIREAFSKTAVRLRDPANAGGAGSLHVYRAYKWLSYRQEGKTIDPTRAEATFKEGRAAQGNEAILKKFHRAAELDPTNAKYPWALGTTYLAENNLDVAKAYLQEAVWLSWTFAFAHHNLGVVLERQGDLRSALRHYQIAHRWEPQRAETLANIQRLEGRTSLATSGL